MCVCCVYIVFINYIFNLYRTYFPSLNLTNPQQQFISAGPQKSRDILMPSSLPTSAAGKSPEVTSSSAAAGSDVAPQHP